VILEVVCAVSVVSLVGLVWKALNTVSVVSGEAIQKNDKERRDYLNSISVLIEKAVTTDSQRTEFNHVAERQNRVVVDAKVDQTEIMAYQNPEHDNTDTDAVLN
jgi:hypothetical protein